MASTTTAWLLANASGLWTTCQGGRKQWQPWLCSLPSTGKAVSPSAVGGETELRPLEALGPKDMQRSITLDRTSNTMLIRNGESKHSYLIPDLWRKAFSFSTLSIKLLSMNFSYMAFIILKKCPFLLSLLSFLINKVS